MPIPTNRLPGIAQVEDDDTIVGNDGGDTTGITKQFSGAAFLRPQQLGGDVPSPEQVNDKVSKSGDTMSGELVFESDAPAVVFVEDDQASDHRRWVLVPIDEVFRVQVTNDDGSVSYEPIRVSRTGELELDQNIAVVVPVPTEDDHAARKSDVDAKVSKSGDTMTGDLTIEDDDPWLILRNANGAPDARGWGVRTHISGDLRFYVKRDDGTDGPLLFRLTQDGQAIFIGSSLVVPANSGTGAVNQAARVTQRDPVTGRLQIDGIEVGETPWIDGLPYLMSGWTASEIWVKRDRNTIWLGVEGLNGSSSTSFNFLSLPAGLRPNGRPETLTTRIPGIFDGTSVTRAALPLTQNSAGVIGADQTITNGHTMAPVGFTTDSWPTSI